VIYNYFREYWELYHSVTFDGVNKLILINDGISIIDVQRDIYSSWKEWVLYEINSQYLPALLTIGGEPTVAGQKLDITYFLINGWKIKPYPGIYDLNIIGNIFSDDGSSIKIAADVIKNQPNNITLNTNTSVIVRQVSGGSGGTVGEYDSDFESINTQFITVNNKLISIESILQQPLVSELIPSQSDILTELQLKINELWKVHGLDENNPLLVTQTSRIAGSVNQTINTTGANETQQTVVTRN
jgi:hypothetical protein